MNLSEAFKRLELLDEDVFNLTKDGLEDLKDFEEDSDEEVDVIDVVDPDAESEEDLKDSYIGKVILDCEVCHTDIYKDKEDITIDEETQLANVGEECPYCFSNEGFTIIGEVKPFVETTFETDDDVDVEVDGEEVEKDEEEEETESLHEDTVKQGKSWVNKGDEGTHGKFRTKKAADEQRKAMFARGYKAESLKESKNKIYKIWFADLEQVDNDYNKLNETKFKVLLKKLMGPNCKLVSYTYKNSNGNAEAMFKSSNLKDLYDGAVKVIDDPDEIIWQLAEDNNITEEEVNAAININEAFSRRNRRLKESCSINQCQKWVDYDMKKYKKISDDTMEKIKSSGYSVVKDQYGDYEVIADRKDESLKESQSLKSDKGNRLYVGWTPFNSFDDFKNRWFENDSYDKYVIYKNGDKWVITTKHAYEKSDNPTWYEIDPRLMKDIKKDVELKKLVKESLKESIEDITIDTGDQEISVSAKDKEEVKSEDEMITPLSDEVKTEIEDKSNDMADVDIDEFSEEEFDELGESYLKKVYENVSNYKTTSAKIKGNKLYLEGLIKFNSGKTKKTSFIFESKTLDKNNKAKFIGENVQISRGHKSFKLTGTLNNNKFIAESLNYNYKAKDGSGNSKRIYGTVKVK